MAKYSGILICSDLDGTLVNSKNAITQEVAHAISYFQQNGGLFTIASGRSPFYLSSFLEHIELNCPVIAHNGATLYDFKKSCFIKKSFMPSNSLDLFDFIWENWKGINFITLHSLDNSYNFAVEQKSELLGLYHKKQWCKFVLYMEDANSTKNLQKLLTESAFSEKYNFVRSWATGLEILSPIGTKGDAVKALRCHLPSVRKVVCIGDYENDITMIKCADIGYAVANACQEVLDIADRVTVSNDNGAVAKVIYEL